MQLKKKRNTLRSPRPKFRAKMWIFSASLVVASLVVFLWWAVGTELPKVSSLAISRHNEFSQGAPKDRLKIATYNIGFGQGIKDSPLDFRDEAYTRKTLARVGAVVQKMDADILLLQEVDLASDRSHQIDQADILITHGGFAYSACAVVWDKNYVPFPFWPPQFHIGEIKTANCVLSKYPIRSHQRIIFEKPESNPFWYNWGYLDRGAHKVEIQIGNRTLYVINLHLEAYEQAAREKQAGILIDWVKDIKGPLVIGGDFNAVPRNATRLDNFPDEPEITYVTDTTLETIKSGLIQFSEAVPSEYCANHEVSCLTFRSDLPLRQLDHLFATRGARFVSGETFLEAKEASDHLPVVGFLEF